MNCTKCKTTMSQAKLSADQYGLGVCLTNKKKGIFEATKSSDVTCFVCPRCGCIALQADNPEKLGLN